MKPETRQLDRAGAVKAIYWGMIAAQVDPNPSGRVDGQKMVDLITGIAPDVKAEADTMLATRRFPPE